MTQKNRRMLSSILGVLVLILAAGIAWAQSGSQGTIVVTVQDVSGGVVQDANLELVDLATNDTRKAKTRSEGNYTFVDLPIGVYKLTVAKPGYSTTLLESIIVHAAQTTSAQVALQVGAASETVAVVASATPLLDETSNSIGSVIDLKWIEDLPMIGRDLTALAKLTPGYAGNVTGGTGVWNGQPFADQGSNIDGVVGEPTRGKYTGAATPAASPRVENIEEMSVVTDQLDLDQGFGLSTMQINFVTRAGTNQYHGRVFEDARNSGLFANTYAHNVSGQRRTKVIYNDFGGSVGGPVLHDKLFFFAGFSSRRVPGGNDTSNNYLTSALQGGDFTYTGTDVDKSGNAVVHTVNLFTLAGQYNAVNNTSLPTKMNSAVSGEISAINTSLSSGSTSTTSDPNIGMVTWAAPAPNIYYYPAARLDYTLSEKVRMNLVWNMTNQTQKGAYTPDFPGSGFSGQGGSYHTRDYTAGYGLDVTLTPNLVNQFKVGYLYNVHQYAVDAKPYYDTEPTVYWDLTSYAFSPNSGNMSGQIYTLPTTNYYPVLNVSDSINWQKGAHSFKFGFSGYREQDHYWNPPAGMANQYLGMATGDPAANAFSAGTLPNSSSSTLAEAEAMYAVLAGRISYVGGNYTYSQKTGAYSTKISSYNLDERQTAEGLFFQDSWHALKNLTINYGLRWDFTGDNYDLTGAYHSVSEASIYGPSGVGNLFNPGSLRGTNNPTIDAKQHVYAPWNVSPQPAVGLAWNPKDLDGLAGKLLGEGKTVFRASFNLRRYTMPQQYYWDNASDYAAFFYQDFYLEPNTTGEAGTYTPGSLSLGDTLPAFGLSPATYVKSESLADFTFINSPGVVGIDPHIKQPYTESWNFGVERQFGHSALEIRYNGNRSIHQWLALNPNEVNIFENGFLTEFKKAQQNLTAYEAANPNCGQDGYPVCSFADNGLAGQSALPIMNAAFAGESSLGAGIGLADYANSSFLNYIETGQAGAMAYVLSGVSGTTTYFCNLVGSSFAPCVSNAGYTGAGAGYPTNFFQANPYAAGSSTSYMTAAGYTNYNSLQVDYRMQQWKGIAMDANYTFGKTLGVGSTRSWTGSADNLMTLRNIGKGYGPTPYDIRQVLHVNGTYDLPIGRGKAFLNTNGIASRVLGNWTVGSILTFQSGAAQQIYGGNATYNDYADGGITLTGVTRRQLQKAVGVHRVPGTTYATLLDSKYLNSTSGGAANTKYISANTTPGTIGDVLFLYGPHAFYHDLSLSKVFPIREKINFKLQSEFLNVWNHPVFGSTPSSFGNGSNVQSSSFAIGSVTNNPRWIEIRANVEF